MIRSAKESQLHVVICTFIIGLIIDSATVSHAASIQSSSSDGAAGEHVVVGSPQKAAAQSGYEIRTISGEPNYKSVNLTWEVEFVPAAANETGNALPKVFQIYYCELQSFGAHRCRSKVVEDKEAASGEDVKHFSTRIDNLRMATKYSFHIKTQPKKKIQKVSGRSEVIDNEVGTEAVNAGETIIIPTKGFSAQATKCLPHASEIEVETGPYFGGKIVVDGGNCGIKGNPSDAQDKYVMRIDHKMCGSLVKQDTNTVETFITVQENLGIFTHSTRRFVVVCSFQSGMQTVRASFTVPGKGGVASAVEDDPFQPDRNGRQRKFRYVDKTGLILKPEEPEKVEKDEEASVAEVESIMPGVNEVDIKHSGDEPPKVVLPLRQSRKTLRQAKFARLVHEEDDRRNEASTHSLATSFNGFVITIALSVIMIGVFVFVMQREFRRQRHHDSSERRTIAKH